MIKAHIGTVESGKSLRLIEEYYKHRNNNNIAILKPSIDTRNGIFIHTRFGQDENGTKIECEMWKENTTIFNILQTIQDGILAYEYDKILIDECQFLDEIQYNSILEYNMINNECEILLYGLKNNYKSKLFPIMKRVIETADDIIEIPTFCWCGKQAKQSAKYKNGEVIKEGDNIEIGYNYTPLCNYHYNKGMLKE